MPEVVIPYRPRQQFIEYHARQQRFACVVAHRRFGKTTGCINDLQRGALTCPLPAPRFAYVAPLLKQAKDVAWDKLKFIARPLMKHGAQINEAETRIDYPNGGRVRLYGADNPDALRGVGLDGIVLDEYAQIDPTLWPEVIRPSLADRQGWATFIGTPRGRDAFWKVWRTAVSNPGDWFARMFRASETGVLRKDELDAMRAEMSEAQYAREMECSFDEPDESQFISASVALLARDRHVLGNGPRLLGVDIARGNGDFNVILLRDGDRVPPEGIIRFRNPDLMQTVGRVSEAIERWKPAATFLDGVGVGGGVVDRLRQLRFPVVEVNSGSQAMTPDRFSNLKAEMWAKMREWLKDRGSIPHDEPLLDDLTAPTYSFDMRNRLKIESKDDLRSRGIPSPDTADALALTFAQPVASSDVQARWQNEAYAPDYDPFS